MLWTDETEPKIREAFQIANSWRNSHMYPMRSVRAQVIWHMHHNNLKGTTGARLKRMPAIRRKLRRETFSLHINQLQDLGGVRAILSSIADVRALIDTIRAKSHHELYEQDDYISSPKPDGYRSHHLMFKFRDQRNAGIHDGRRIELQVRTRLQHSWATAVEAVGLFLGEDLKSGHGSPDWLRLIVLMSAELARAEECPEPPGVPARHLRINEIKALNKTLKAVKVLDDLSHIVKWTDEFAVTLREATHYLIKYDNITREVRVESYIAPRLAVSSYDEAEFLDFKTGMDRKNIVLVEVDKIENLKEAYPNYFGDVQLFRKQLKDITKGKSAQEYTLPPRQTTPPPHKENPNLAWLRRRKHIRWK
jgi:Region found in RelA / SpoT proteins